MPAGETLETTMNQPSQEPGVYRAGFVALMGRPNVGKSTLLNALLEFPVAAVSPRPQTTRRRQLGILTLPDAQIIFEDTPGLHIPRHKLGELMNQEALEALPHTDVIVFVVDASKPPHPEDAALAEALHKAPGPAVLLALNMIDLASPDVLEAHAAAYQALAPQAEPVRLSALSGENLAGLLEAIRRRLPERPPDYPEDQITDLYEKDIAADLIRAAALLHLRDEIPHGIAVRIDEFTERGEAGAFIAATLFVERENHKGIVIGAGGSMLKQIGVSARQQIEAMSGRQVYLQLRVKVRKNWRDDPEALKLFGFKRPEKSRR